MISAVPLFAQNTLPTSGNVGIGTSSPQCQLEVQGNTDLSGKVVMRDSVNVEGELIIQQNLMIEGSTRNRGDFTVLGGVYLPRIADTAVVPEDRFLYLSGDGEVKSLEKAGLVGLAYDAPAFCIVDSDGNYPAPHWTQLSGNPAVLYTGIDCPTVVGIGTDSPQGKLDVRGKTYLKQTAPQLNALEVEFTSSSPTVTGIGINIIVDHADRRALNVLNTSVGDVFSVSGDGTVSIGNQQDLNNALEVINQSGSQVFKVQGNGNVSIMNKAKLIFDGTQPNWNSWESAICAPMGAAWVTSQPTSGSSPIPGYYTGFGMTNTGFYYGRSANEIGSSSTDIQYLFSVDLEGRIKGRAIKIFDFGWADHVFDENYELITLSELEGYIKQNKHLPGVPSETELLMDGLDIGTMQQIQMQKIEELTLYIIELERKIEASKE